MAPRPKNQFRERVPCYSGLELRRTVSVVVIHLGHVLDELGLRLAVAAHPVLVYQTVGIVVLAVDVVLVEPIVPVVVDGVDRAVVDIVVRTSRIAHSREQRAGRAEGGAPLELVVSVQVDPIAALVDLLVDIRQRRDPGHGVVSQVLPPTAGPTVLPCGLAAVLLTIVAVAIDIEHGYHIDLPRIDQVGDELLREVLVHPQVPRTACDAVAIVVLIARIEHRTIPIVIDAVPGILVNQAVAVVVHPGLTVVVRHGLYEQHRDGVGHPLPCVVGTYEHDIGAVSVVAAVPYEGVAISSGRVRRDLHPGTGVVVVPALIVIGAHLVATGVDAADESFME